MPDHPHHAIGSDSEDEHESDGEDVSSTEGKGSNRTAASITNRDGRFRLAHHATWPPDRRHASYLGMNDREEDGEDGEANLTGVEEDEKLLNKPSAILDGTEGETQLEDEEKGHHPPRSTSVLPLQLEGSAAHRSRRRSLSRVGEDAGVSCNDDMGLFPYVPLARLTCLFSDSPLRPFPCRPISDASLAW